MSKLFVKDVEVYALTGGANHWFVKLITTDSAEKTGGKDGTPIRADFTRQLIDQWFGSIQLADDGKERWRPWKQEIADKSPQAKKGNFVPTLAKWPSVKKIYDAVSSMDNAGCEVLEEDKNDCKDYVDKILQYVLGICDGKDKPCLNRQKKTLNDEKKTSILAGALDHAEASDSNKPLVPPKRSPTPDNGSSDSECGKKKNKKRKLDGKIVEQ